MRFYVLPVLIGFLAGIVLDLSVTRFVLDLVLFCSVVGTTAVVLLMAHYQSPRKKVSSRRSHLKLVKTRKIASR